MHKSIRVQRRHDKSLCRRRSGPDRLDSDDVDIDIDDNDNDNDNDNDDSDDVDSDGNDNDAGGKKRRSYANDQQPEMVFQKSEKHFHVEILISKAKERWTEVQQSYLKHCSTTILGTAVLKLGPCLPWET